MVNMIGRRVDIQQLGGAATDNGMGATLAGLGKTLFGDTLTPAYKREMIRKLEDENALRASAVNNFGADGNIVDPRLGAIAAAMGTIDPSKLGRMRAIEATRTHGVDSPQAAEALTGLGQYGSTPLYGQRDFANKIEMQQLQENTKLRIADNQIREVNGPDGPVLVRQGDAPGMQPLLSVDQTKAIEAGRLLPTLPDGQRQAFALGTSGQEIGNVTTASGSIPAVAIPGGGFRNQQTGAPITEPITSFGKLTATTTDGLKPTDEPIRQIRDARITTDNALTQIGALKNELAKPNSGAALGLVGKVAEATNYARAQFEAAIKLTNPGDLGVAGEVQRPEIAQTIDNAIRANPQFVQKAQQLGIDTAILRSQVQNLAYIIAKTNDPSGKMGVQDVESALAQIGGSLGDPVAMSRVLDSVAGSISQQQQTRERVYRTMYGDKLGGVPEWAPPGAPAAVGSAPAAPQAGTRLRFNPATGGIE